MSTIRSKNTRPELHLRKALWLRGFRYRIHYCSEKIDIAFLSSKVAVFVDGCFWHNCPLHSHKPKSNLEYWTPKLQKNIERDRAKNERLTLQGWHVIRIWEHELKDIDSVIKTITETIESSQKSPNSKKK